MAKYVLDAQQLTKIMEKAIDLFLEYQYKRGYDEPQARTEAVREIITLLQSVSAERPSDV